MGLGGLGIGIERGGTIWDAAAVWASSGGFADGEENNGFYIQVYFPVSLSKNDVTHASNFHERLLQHLILSRYGAQ
jgi:hypothetical protein